MSEEKDEELERLKKEKMEEIMSEKGGGDFPETSVKVTDDNFREVVDEYPLVVVDFWADWCDPCKRMEPIIEQLAAEYSGRAVFGKMNVDQNRRMPQKFGIASIPTLIIFKDGEPVDKNIGLVRAEDLKRKLDSHLD
ncbi:hypothetical protein AKJ41_00595 [candidate division MSBL1 archaeon SCGC-AAA259O05]|uniref:Thioredoxin domain-containing protein n=1 Tax=candidate division MSBL1 archaeon SCGC-AAA259O05 TaxID=1698271 RepID=A0A133V5G9_9EURY|nr:hypothetical protein AKJ41_00595 [candidate division MSBL1 archaeon SCGC-AAA259O05]